MTREEAIYRPTSNDLIIKGAKGIKDGLYNIQNGELFQYKTKGGTVRAYPIVEALQDDWIPVSEGLPEERKWVGTKRFGTTISDFISITFEVDGQRFVKVMRLQNGELGFSDRQTMDAIHKGWKILAWQPLPEPYKGGDTE